MDMEIRRCVEPVQKVPSQKNENPPKNPVVPTKRVSNKFAKILERTIEAQKDSSKI